jgi:DNA repair exonuclease SbcCD ATPase subunit
MDDQHKNQGKFKMRLDADVDEAPVASQVDELRMEKLSQRVTMISILIPVLIVVVLIIAYMDIKQRVIRTEDTGTSGVQKLSEDMESRFSTLSLRQAKLEELLKRTSDMNNQSLAKIQVNLKKLEDRLKGVGKGLTSKKDLNAKLDPINKKIENMSGAMDESKAGLAKIDQQIQTTLSQMEQTLSDRGSQIKQLQEKVNGLDQAKIDKPALDLAMKLEMLKIKQSFIERLDNIETRIKTLEGKIKSQRQAAPAPQKLPAKPVPLAPPKPSAPTTPSSGDIKEQPIQ